MRVTTLMLILFWISSNLHAANRFWISDINGNWNDESNWATNSAGSGGASVPGPSDKAIFDSDGVGSCYFNIDIEVRGLELKEGYTGILFQNGFDLKVGSQHLQVCGGTLQGDSGSMDVDGQLIVDGGVFIATSDVLYSSGQFAIRDGSFIHNDGTVVFDMDGNREFRCDNVPADRFFKVRIESGTDDQLRIRNGDTLMVSKRVDLIKGTLRNGNLGVIGDAYCHSQFDSGNSNVVLVSASESILYASNGTWSNNDLAVVKEAGYSVTVVDVEDDGQLILGSDNRNLDVLGGTLILPAHETTELHFRNLNIYDGGELICPKDTLVITGNYMNLGGELIHNQGTIAFTGDDNSTFRCDNIEHDRFFNLAISKAADRGLNIRNDDTLYVENRLTLKTGDLTNSAVFIEDSCVVLSEWNQGTSRLIFTGSGDGHLLVDDLTLDMNDIFIHKSLSTEKVTIEDVDGDGQIRLGSDNRRMVINRGGLAFESGLEAQFDFRETIINPNGTLKSTDGILILNGSYLNMGGRLIHNGGTVRFIGSSNSNFRCDAIPCDSFFNVEIAMNNSKDLNLRSGDTLKVLNRLDLINGQADIGKLAIQDTLFLHSGWDEGTVDICFIGSGDGHYLIEDIAWTNPDLAIEKTSETNTVWVEDEDGDGNVVLGSLNRILEIREGVLAFEQDVDVELDYRETIISADGALQGPNTTLNILGSYSNNGGQFIHNNGSVRFHGSSHTQFRSEVTPSEKFYDVIIDKNSNRDVNILASGNLHVTHDLFLTDGQLRLGTVQVDGDVSIASSFDQGNAELLLSGTSDQYITANTLFGNYSSDIIIEKPLGGDVILNRPLRMNRSGQRLYLRHGELVSSVANTLILMDNVVCEDASELSYVNGPLQKIGNDAFTFPVGKEGVYAPISISNPTNTSHSFTAEYFPADPGTFYDPEAIVSSINNISTAEYWILDRGLLTTSNVYVTLSWDVSRSGEINEPSDLIVTRWDDVLWQDHGSSAAVVSPSGESGTVRTAAKVTDFSPFTLGSVSSNNPLPVEWLYFQAELVQGKVRLNWATASEIHSKDFEIQRSQNGVIWDVIDRVEAAGYSSSQLNYESMDDAPLPGVSYYRLKQNDFDGQYEYSEVKAVNNKEESEDTVIAYPNPTEGSMIVQGDFTLIKEMRVYDLKGTDFSSRIDIEWVSDYQAKIDLGELPTGVYLLQASKDVIRVIKK